MLCDVHGWLKGADNAFHGVFLLLLKCGTCYKDKPCGALWNESTTAEVVFVVQACGRALQHSISPPTYMCTVQVWDSAMHSRCYTSLLNGMSSSQCAAVLPGVLVCWETLGNSLAK